MKAMILAAGRGSRLGSLTEHTPKALVEVGGEPLLGHVLRRLRAAGVTDVIINVHHLGRQIEEWVAAQCDSGWRITFSREKKLLDTGGGLKKAAAFFDDDRPFLVHNVDVLSDIDLIAAVAAHRQSGALATIVAKDRSTQRPLLFDQHDELCGRVVRDRQELVRIPEGQVQRRGFCGIHVLSPGILRQLTETGAFSIIDSYLRLAAAGESIRLFSADAFQWRDCGRPEDLRPL